MRIHLVDGTYELFRSYFGAPPKKAPDGREVGAPRRAPTLLEDTPHRVVERLLRRAAGAGILAHRLLGIDRHDRCVSAGGAHRLDVAGCG